MSDIVPVIPSIEELVARAIDKGIPEATMQGFLTMMREVRADRARESYFRALADFQSENHSIPKTKQVKDKGGKVRYAYAPLETIIATIKDSLRDHGFSYTLDAGDQTVESVEAVCMIHHIDGHHERSRFSVPIDKDSYMNAPQKVASALTYAKRYALCNALGIMTADEDDDGNTAGPPRYEKTTKQAVAERKIPDIAKARSEIGKIIERYEAVLSPAFVEACKLDMEGASVEQLREIYQSIKYEGTSAEREEQGGTGKAAMAERFRNRKDDITEDDLAEPELPDGDPEQMEIF